MKKSIALSLLFALTLPAFADEHEHHHPASNEVAGAEDEYVNAEVRKIDADNGKLTLKHEAIRKFNMVGMTMAFRVADPAVLSTLSVGDKVRFIPDKQNGQYVIKSIDRLD